MKPRSVSLLTLRYVVLAVITVLMLLPFVWLLLGSFKTPEEILVDPGAWLPRSFLFDNYITLFAQNDFGNYLLNSVIVSVIAVTSDVLLSAMGGYALAKLRFRGKRVVFALVMLSMFMPYIALVVPSFMVIVQLGLVNTLLGIVIPIIVMPLSMFIMRQYAYSIPFELLEAARLDGAGEHRIFFRIFLPLAGPGVATVAILSFLGSWNYFLWPLIVAQTQDVYTAPVGLAIASKVARTTDFGVMLAGSMVILLPVLILFLLLQRRFIQGVASIGLK